MKTILSLKRHHYLKTVGIFLIAIALIAGVVSCGDGVTKYDLTMAENPAAGGTANDLTGRSPYTALTVVDIQAAPAATYQFCKWTTTGGIFVDPNAATTKFIMPAQNVTVTANFVGPLDHFKGYPVEDATYLEGKNVTLNDQFVDDLYVQVKQAVGFFNPVEKTLGQEPTPISNPDHHLTIYSIEYNFEEEYVMRSVEVSNQFGKNQTLTVLGPIGLAVPTQKVVPGGHEPPLCLNHFLLYLVKDGPDVGEVVSLNDQFGLDKDVSVSTPYLFANPVEKTDASGVTETMTDEHLVFYEIVIEEQYDYTQVEVDNQFGKQSLNLSTPAELLAVPSVKNVPPVPPLDHFKCYSAGGSPLVDPVVYVDLQDQFGYYEDAQVLYADGFCNPVDKVHEGQTTLSNPDNHLMLYWLDKMEPQMWDVEVYNQFGTQLLRVSGPVALAVPTQKGGHPEPKYLDHFLLYDVKIGTPLEDVSVNLDDQFPESAPEVTVTTPAYFANPVLVKEHGEDITVVWNPEAHLVFYVISDNPEDPPDKVLVNNQFEEGLLLPLDDPPIFEFLAVPSEKISFKPVESWPLALDHFKCYNANGAPPFEDVQLEDQFIADWLGEPISATVDMALFFGNPVEKWLGEGEGTPILNWDHHLTWYSISYIEEPQMWTVTVINQFGMDQKLLVQGPYWLAVPTWKLDPAYHDPPVGLDHFLVYKVIEGPSAGAVVELWDQFSLEPEPEMVEVGYPLYFANPVQKTHDGKVTYIENEDAHLVFYAIAGEFSTGVLVSNQFYLEPQPLDVYDPALLGVPSEKKDWYREPL